ncbi:tigger transposable element-derived protein 6-like [Hydractinia symbiolongicarpus]|uniref:tigger transposable element-derived protein 6-like n=1 Tax=Hydractinia symbiolongicarpus TaxID=13093 RepID=UPI002550EDE9|nr:tigger transposable element-derived protein 6-like [Hydractinia symbiolongicarpus]
MTVLHIANALGEKETPVIIGHSQKPRCFKNVQDEKRPCGTYSYANKKAWMDSELLEEILRTLNKKCATDYRKILLFIDNVPSHPQSFIDCFSQVFLPKDTTSKLQPLDAGIIKNFKVFYRKQLLQHVLARIKPGCKTSDVIRNVDLLKSIGWVINAWGKVKKETIVICFSKCGFTEATL